MKAYKKDFLTFIMAIILLTFIKFPFIFDESNNFCDFFYSFYIMYGDHVIFNVIWLMPILITIFFSTRNIYLRLLNFNLRYHNRKTACINILISLVKLVIIFSLFSIIIPLPVLLLKTTNNIIINLSIIIFIIKYIIELTTISLMIILIGLLLKNYTYSFVAITTMIIICLSGYKNNYLPLISLYLNNNINLLSIIISSICLFIIYKLYTSKDILGGHTK